MQLPSALRALSYRDFRYYIAGQGTSQIGNWMQMITVSWLMYRLTGSTLMLGLATFALNIPFMMIAPLAGVMIDRLDVRRVLYLTNAVAFLQAAVMLALVATGAVQPWHLVLGNFVLGIVNACDAPARQSVLVRLIGRREDLPNAIALNSSTMSSARFIGPMVGGMVIAAFGESWGFAVNLMLRGAVIAALMALHFEKRAPAPRHTGLIGELAEGLRYIWGSLPSRSALLLLAATSLTVQSYPSLMPWFASQRFHGDSTTLGHLMSAGGIGALVGMIYLATRSSVIGLFRVIAVNSALAGAALIAFSFTPSVVLGLALICVTSMSMMVTATSTNTVLQTLVPDALRGRVAAIYVVCFLGMSPFGALLNGWLAEHIGPPHALALSGSLTLLAAAFYVSRMAAIRRQVAPLYREMGILPANGG